MSKQGMERIEQMERAKESIDEVLTDLDAFMKDHPLDTQVNKTVGLALMAHINHLENESELLQEKIFEAKRSIQ